MPIYDYMIERIRNSNKEIITLNGVVIDDSIQLICDLVREKKEIIGLELTHCNLTDAVIKELARALPPQITWLDVSFNGLTDEGAKALIELPSLRTLDLSYNKHLSNQTGQALLESDHLSFINLEHTKLAGNEALVAAIESKMDTNREKQRAAQPSLVNSTVETLFSKHQPETTPIQEKGAKLSTTNRQ